MQVGRLFATLSLKDKNFAANVDKSIGKLRSLQSEMNTIAISAGAVSAGVIAAGAAVASSFAKFESSLTRAAAVAAGGAKGFNTAFASMSDSAVDLAGKSSFTAKEVADGMGFMAMAGNNARQTIEAMPAAIQLASAAQQDLASATDTVTNIMAGFQIKADETGTTAQKLANANNILVGTFANANVSLQELGESMKIAGPVASALGVSIEETAAALGILGNAGIKGSLAGTGLKRIFTSLAKDATPKAKKALEALGVSMDTIEKKGIAGLVRQLELAKNALGDQAFTGAVFTAFGERAGPQLQALVGQGADAVDKLLGKIKDAQGANITGFLQEKQLATLSGQFDILTSNIEAAAIKFGERLAPALKPVVTTLMDMFKALTVMDKATIDSIITVGKWIAIVTGVVGATAAAVSALAGLKVIFMTVAAAASTASATLSLGLGPALLAIGAAVASFNLTLKAYEAITGKSISVTQAFSDAMHDMSRDARGTELVMRQLADSVGFLGDFKSGELSDAIALKNAGSMFTGLRKELFDVDVALTKLQKRRDLLQQSGAVMGASRNGVLLQSSVELKKVNEDILANEKSRAFLLGRIRDAKKRQIAADKKAAELAAKKKQDEESAAKAEEKRIRARERALKREEEARKRLLKMQKQARALLAEMPQQLTQETARINAGEFGGLLGNIQQFKNSVDDVAEAFTVLGKKADIGEINALTGLLEDRLMAQARAFVESAKGTEDFAEVVETVVDMLNRELPGMDVTAKDLTSGENLDLTPAQDAIDAMRRAFERTGNIIGDDAEMAGDEFGRTLERIWANVDTSSLAALVNTGLEESMREFLLAIDAPTAAPMFTDEFALNLTELSEVIGGEMMSAVSGSGGSIGSIIGAAIGSAIPGVGTAVGAAVGQMVEQVIGQAAAAVQDAIFGLADAINMGVDSLIAMIPEGRLGGAVQNAVEPLKAGLMAAATAAAALVPVAIALAPVLAAAGLAAATLALTLGGFALLLAPLAALAAVIVAANVAIVAAVGSIVAVIVGTLLAPLVALAAVATVLTAGLTGIFVIFATLASLATETESFARMMMGMEQVVSDLITSLEPLFARFGPMMVGLFAQTVAVLMPFVDVMVQNTDLMKIFFGAAKLAAQGFAASAFAVALLQNAILGTVAGFAQFGNRIMLGINTIIVAFKQGASLLLDAMAFVADLIPGVTGEALRDSAAQLRADAANQMTDETALTDLARSAEGLMVDMDELGAGVNRVNELSMAQAEVIGNETIARADTTESLNTLNESLTNVPTGVKVALERFRAATPGLGPNEPLAPGAEAQGAAAGGNNVGEININGVTDPEEVARIVIEFLQNQSDLLSGNPFGGDAFNPGFG